MKFYTEKNINYLLLSIYFFYFTSSLLGSFQPQATIKPTVDAKYADEQYFEKIVIENPAKGSKDSSLKDSLEKDSLEELPLLPLKKKGGIETEAAKTRKEAKYVWKYRPGLLPLVLLQRETRQQLQDSILENEATPSLLFDELNYTYAENLSKLALVLFWMLSLLLCFIALVKRHWFYRPMSSIVFFISLITVLYVLGTARKLEIDELANISLWPKMLAALELALVFATASLLIGRTLPQRSPKGLQLKMDFMEHLRLPVARVGKGISNMFQIILHVGMLFLASLILSNLLLLPLYKLQLNLQGIFVFFIVALLAILSAWYIRAYTKLVEEQGRSSDFFSGLAFLGYRFIKNTLFIGTVIVVVSLVFVLILLLTVYNTQILQYLHLLPVEASL